MTFRCREACFFPFVGYVIAGKKMNCSALQEKRVPFYNWLKIKKKFLFLWKRLFCLRERAFFADESENHRLSFCTYGFNPYFCGKKSKGRTL